MSSKDNQAGTATMEKMSKAILSFLEPLSLEETYKRVVDEAVSLVNGNYGSLIFNYGNDFLKVYSSAPEGYQFTPNKKGYAYESYTKRKAILLDTKKTPGVHPELKELGIKTILMIPLSYKNKAIGVLIVNSKKNIKYNVSDLKTLQLFGSIASLAIRKSQLNNETSNALQARDLFISMASHELKTPLTTIHGYTQLLKTKLEGESGIIKSWVNELSKEVARLNLLVKELLEVNRIKSGSLHYVYKESNIVEIIDRAVKTLEFGYPNHKVVFDNKIGNSTKVIGDQDKLIQAFSNILKNAAKYSPNNEDIKISLSALQNRLKICIKDKGIGIREAELASLFIGYMQGKNHQREGLGLGLYLTKSIIDSHYGKINIKSKENHGTTVEVILPRVHINATKILSH